jgi:hypothetical protein
MKVARRLPAYENEHANDDHHNGDHKRHAHANSADVATTPTFPDEVAREFLNGRYRFRINM